MVKVIKLRDWFGQGLRGMAPQRTPSRVEVHFPVGVSLLAVTSAQPMQFLNQSASLRIKLR